MKNKSAVELGRLGGKAGTGSCKARTSEQARYAAEVRWGKAKSRPLRSKKSTLAQRFASLLYVITTGNRKVNGITPFGCTQDDLVWHIERQFKVTDAGACMSWRRRGNWNIDHIAPMSSYDPEDIVDMLEVNHWTNLQVLWCEDNIEKGDRDIEIGMRPCIEIRQEWNPRNTIINEHGMAEPITRTDNGTRRDDDKYRAQRVATRKAR